MNRGKESGKLYDRLRKKCEKCGGRVALIKVDVFKDTFKCRKCKKLYFISFPRPKKKG